MKRNLIAGAVLVLILAGVLLANFLIGSGTGAPCRSHEDCRVSLWGQLGAQCYAEPGRIEGYCAPTCAAAADCPPGWSCEAVDDIVNDVKKGVNRVCVRPSPAGAQAAAPASTR